MTLRLTRLVAFAAGFSLLATGCATSRIEPSALRVWLAAPGRFALEPSAVDTVPVLVTLRPRRTRTAGIEVALSPASRDSDALSMLIRQIEAGRLPGWQHASAPIAVTLEAGTHDFRTMKAGEIRHDVTGGWTYREAGVDVALVFDGTRGSSRLTIACNAENDDARVPWCLQWSVSPDEPESLAALFSSKGSRPNGGSFVGLVSAPFELILVRMS